MTPTYKIPPYDGYKRVTFKADVRNRVFHYLCKPGASDKEVRARGRQAHEYANSQRKLFYKEFIPSLKEISKKKGVDMRLRFAEDAAKFWEKTEQTMEARYDCIFYRTPAEARIGI